MKKTLRTLALAALALVSTGSFAQEKLIFNEDLLVVVDSMAAPKQTACIEVTPNADGTINFSLKNFLLISGEDVMNVGNISVENLVLTPVSEEAQSFNYNGDIMIQPGDLEDVDPSDWIGPMLGPIPLDLNGVLSYEHMYATININFTALQQIIYVELGDKSNFDKGEPSAVSAAAGNDAVAAETYTLGGAKVTAAIKGINIVKMSDGSVKKMLVK